VFGNISVYEPSLDSYDSNIKILNVGHYRQSSKYTCGHAVVMNLMYYYKMLSAKDMNQQTEMRISMEMHATTAGTTESQVVSWLVYRKDKHHISTKSPPPPNPPHLQNTRR
jgi:hypothetical protein